MKKILFVLACAGLSLSLSSCCPTMWDDLAYYGPTHEVVIHTHHGHHAPPPVHRAHKHTHRW